MQIKTPYDFTLDIVKPTKIPYMEFYQTDVNTSQMYISITNNDEAVDLTGHTLILNIKKADGTEIQNLATVEDSVKGLVNVSLTTQSLTALGECRVQLTVFSGETRKSTHEFKYYVKASLLNAEVPLSSNEYGLLLQLIGEVQTVENILNTSETERVQAENNRVILYGQLSTLKTDLETLQGQLNSLETNIENEEEARQLSEEARETLKGQLDTLKAELEELQTELNDLNSTVNSNEETRKSNEIQRQANELDRVELKGQLDSLKGTLESLENTLNTNDATRTNTVNNKMYEVDNKVVNYEAIITDIQNRFSLLSTATQQASEVINARTSTIRNKTFTDLNKRIEEAEKDILTQQSTQVTDNISYMNVLANSLDGATDVSIKGNTLVNLYPDNVEKVLPIPLSLVDRVDSVIHLGNTLEGNGEFNLKGQSLVQLVKNGNFVNTNGWTTSGATISTSNNTLTITGSGSTSIPFVQNIINKFNINTKLFSKLKARVTNNNCTRIRLRLYANGGSALGDIDINNPVQNQWYSLNGIYQVLSGNENKDILISIQHHYADATTATGKTMEVQEAMALDLTSLGLDTKTADEINAMLPTYFEGIGSVENTTIKSIGENLFDKTKVTPSMWINEFGAMNTSGVTDTSDYIKVKSNTSYFFSGFVDTTGRACAFYDANKIFISGINTIHNRQITTPSNATYIRFGLPKADIETIMFNIGTSAKPYSAYRSSSITVTDTLRSVGSVYDEYLGNKKVTRVGRVVLNGSESGWSLITTYTNNIRYNINIPSVKLSGQIISNLIPKGIAGTDTENIDTHSSLNMIQITLSKTKATDLATFKTWLSTNNIEVLYELNTPTETTITPLTLPTYLNGTLIVEPTKLFPKLSSQDTFDRTINLKPSTLYSIFVNAKNTGTLEVDLGGIKGNITPTTTYTNNKVTITTPSTLTHSMLKLKGGNISTKDYMVIEGDILEPKYFSGISSVDSDVVVKSIGENLFDITKITKGKYHNCNTTTGLFTITDNANYNISDFIRIKPSATYTKTYIAEGIYYDLNKKPITNVIASTTTFTTPNNAYYIIFNINATYTSGHILNEGATAKPYTPYKEDKLTLSEYLLPEHFPLRSVGGVSDEYVGKKLYKRLEKTIFSPNAILSATTDLGTYYRIGYYIDTYIQNINSVVSSICFVGSKNIPYENNWTKDGLHFYTDKAGSTNNRDAIFLYLPKTDIDSMSGATLNEKFNNYLIQNQVTLYYSLKTPTEINLDRPLNLQVYKNGSIVTEPTKLLPKLSYNFPTNINSGLVGIQKSLQNVKDNQNFIMAYMLDLETRLSLIEGGM